MKIFLVKPGIKLSDHIQPPLGLGYIAASIIANTGAEVSIIDLPKNGNKATVLFDRIKSEHPDIVGIQCYSPEISVVKSLLTHIKAINAGIITVVGGPHPTLLPDETMRYFGKDVDFLITGEAERSFVSFIRHLENKTDIKDVEGIVWRETDIVKKNAPGFIENVNNLPLPAWQLIKPDEYPPSQHGAFYNKFPIAPIVTTRGCPFSCEFCSAPLLSGRKIRSRSADSIIEEINLLYHNFGIREIHIVDDNFTIDKNHAKNVLQRIIENGRDISISFPNGVRIESLDEELLELMKRAGVYLISVGIESGTNEVLKAMKKSLTVAMIREKMKLINKFRIDTAGFFVIGFPGETVEQIKKTIRFSLELNLIRANYFNFIPLPKTPVFEKLKAKGELRDVNWDTFLFITTPYLSSMLHGTKLRSLQREAFRRFYFRPSILFRNITKIRSLTHLKYLLRRFYHWILY